jgi:hypothetical protein
MAHRGNHRRIVLPGTGAVTKEDQSRVFSAHDRAAALIIAQQAALCKLLRVLGRILSRDSISRMPI